jgi:magnesium chelatase subunit D
MAAPDIVQTLYRSALLAALTNVGVHLRSASDPLRDAWILLVHNIRIQLGQNSTKVNIPLHADDDALFGGVDISASLGSAKAIRTPGLINHCAGAMVLISMAERLNLSQASKLSQGFDRISSQGANACVIALDEAGVDEEAIVPDCLTERLGMLVDLHGLQVEHWRLLEQCELPPENAGELKRILATLNSVAIDDQMIDTLAQVSLTLGIRSFRPTAAALSVIRANAALEGRDQADASDLDTALRLVLVPKATQFPAPQFPAPQQDSAPQEPLPEEESATQDPNNNNAQPAQDSQSAEVNVEQMADLVLQASLAALPADLLLRLASKTKMRLAASGSSGSLQSNPHGRKGRIMRQARNQRPDLIATLQESARWQKIRLGNSNSLATKLVIEKSDFRYRQAEQKARSTLIFAVDASGSAAMQRLAETKGAIELLLAQCYIRRDQVAMICFRGPKAEVILSATRSLTRAKRQLAGLPGGGGTPIAAGLDCAVVEAKRAIKRGETPYIVVLSDGRANITRAGQPGRATAHQEALNSAKQLSAQGITSLFIDTSQSIGTRQGGQLGSQPAGQPLAREIAQAMQATYLPLPQAGAQRLAQAVDRALDLR